MEEIEYEGKIFNGSYLYIENGIWRRNESKNMSDSCLIELGGNIKFLTKENCFNNPNFIYIRKDMEDTYNMICMCGQDNCRKLYIVEHIPTKIKIGVGSSCINKFKPINYDNINRTNFCISCNKCLWYKKSKNHNRNAIKNLDNCVSCTYKILCLL
jgi:hypothetical protein